MPVIFTQPIAVRRALFWRVWIRLIEAGGLEEVESEEGETEAIGNQIGAQ